MSSFNPATLAHLRGVARRRRDSVAYLSTATIGVAIDRCVEDGHVALHPYHGTVDAGARRAAHDAGLAINVWTVDDAPRMRDATSWHVDGICTNRIDVASRGVPAVGQQLMKILLIVNAAASSVTLRSRVLVQKALGGRTRGARSPKPAAVAMPHGSPKARPAQGTDLVIVFGGDGTLNEAANGLVGSDTASGSAAGRIDQRVRPHARPFRRPGRGDGRAARRDRSRCYRRVGLGSVNRRYFLFHCGVGFDAAVVEQVERRAGLKRYAGHPLFMYAAVHTWMRHYDRKPTALPSAMYEDGSVVDDGYFAICCNTDPYTYLGSRPLHLAPDATLDSPLTMVTLRIAGAAPARPGWCRRRCSPTGSELRPQPPRRLPARRASGDRRRDRPFPYQVDGDFLGAVRSTRVPLRARCHRCCSSP